MTVWWFVAGGCLSSLLRQVSDEIAYVAVFAAVPEVPLKWLKLFLGGTGLAFAGFCVCILLAMVSA